MKQHTHSIKPNLLLSSHEPTGSIQRNGDQSSARVNARVLLLGLLSLLLLVAGPASAGAATRFKFTETDEKSLMLWDGIHPVLVYNHGVIHRAGVPEDRSRSSYVHPLYGLDGEILTDDFPEDHYHHRGLFWSWPHVKIDGNEYDLWMLRGVRHEFENWLSRGVKDSQATLGVENGWYVGDEKVMAEQVWLTVHAASKDARAIDVDLTWIPQRNPVTLRGAEGKSYGGLTIRYAPREDAVITTPLGHEPEDLHITPLPWADYSGRFGGHQRPSGAALFVSPRHPDYPPEWLTRHYGALCVGWPGVEEKTFAPGEAIRCRYRVWVHRGQPTQSRLEEAYASYVAAEAPVAGSPSPAQELRAAVTADRVAVLVGDELFTEYRYGPDLKYPYFYPVNGPHSKQSVTVHRTEPYPHHSSIFFGCDRVNGGNYWQEGLERGRIVPTVVRLIKAEGKTVVIEQECRWVRPDAESPFTDRRRITLSAPTSSRRQIDFDVTLTAEEDVRIEKTNHSLFSARMAPELSVKGGGTLVNAGGDSGEQGTFGKAAAWADYRGSWHDVTEGVAILCHPENPSYLSKWFTRDYGFFSPTPMYWPPDDQAIELRKGDSVRLRYRVIVHADAPSHEELGALHSTWAKQR